MGPARCLSRRSTGWPLHTFLCTSRSCAFHQNGPARGDAARCDRPRGFPVLLWLALWAAPAAAQGTSAHVEASASGAMSTAPESNSQYLLRVIPRLDTGTALTKTWNLDLSASVAATTGESYLSGSRVSSIDDVSLHRAWVRLASPRFEARAGMQHISFGSASDLPPADVVRPPRCPGSHPVHRWRLRGAHALCDGGERERLGLGPVRQHRPPRLGHARDAGRHGGVRRARPGACAPRRDRRKLPSPAHRYDAVSVGGGPRRRGDVGQRGPLRRRRQVGLRHRRVVRNQYRPQQQRPSSPEPGCPRTPSAPTTRSRSAAD